MIQYLCKTCGRSFERHNSLNKLCPLCAYNRYTKPKKPLKKVGKVAKKWIETRNEWFKTNPPQDGFYICGICHQPVPFDETVLDHIKARSKRPDLRYDFSNLQPAHYYCNSEKGSKDI